MNEKQIRIVKKKRWVSNENISTNLEQKVDLDFSEKKMGVEMKSRLVKRQKKKREKKMSAPLVHNAIHKKKSFCQILKNCFFCVFFHASAS